MRHRLLLPIALLLLGLGSAAGREFTVVAYNVENLFDVDGVSLFDDYQPSAYGPRQLATKLANVSAVLRRFEDGRGPDLVMFCELEADQTPAGHAVDAAAFLRKWSAHPACELLESAPLPAELADVPAWLWLLKQLTDDGLPPYQAAVGEWRPDPTGRTIAQENVVFSRFPILEQRTHETDGARGVLEVVVEVDGRRLTLLDNHWKSGASDPATEPVRIGNAQVLRRRLDEILRADPHADVILGGDFNSQYNQKQRYPAMPETAMNDVLGSQGDEAAMERDGGPDLYNLWFEVPDERRGSDVFHGEWGTLIQMLLTRGLYDLRGVQYVDNSFTVGAFPGLNADRATGRPVRWRSADGGSGFSDHFPVAARFRTVAPERAGQWLMLTQPSRTREGPSAAVPVAIPAGAIEDLSSWQAGREFRAVENLGRFFRVSGRVTGVRPFRVAVRGGTGGEVGVWVAEPAARAKFFGRFQPGDAIEFTGELGQHKGEWQFVVTETGER